jgi:hypothetical protein
MSYPPYGPPQYGQPSYGPPPDHPQATLALVLGILGAVLCVICAPFAWVIGQRVVREIDASGGRYGGRGQAQAGYILGMIWTILLAVGLAGGLFFGFVGVLG